MTSNAEAGSEFTENKQPISKANGNHAKKEGKSRSWTCGGIIKRVLGFFTIEPFLICYILPFLITYPAEARIVAEKACRVGLGYSEEICTKVINGDTDNNITEVAQMDIITQVIDIESWHSTTGIIIQVIVTLFAGAWSDRTGNRKALMLIPMIGQSIYLLSMIMSIFFLLEWPVIYSVSTALSGGLDVAIMGSFAYLADVTTIELRTFRVGIASAIVVRVIPLALVIRGYLIQNIGLYGVFGIGLAINVIGFIYTLRWIQDVNKVETQGTFLEKLKLFFHPKNMLDTLSMIFWYRGRRQAPIILLICAHIVISGPVFGETRINFLYAMVRFDMNINDNTFFTTYSILLSATGTAVAVTVFSKIFKIHDTILLMIASSSRVVSSFAFGLAPTKRWWIYAGPAFDFFGSTPPFIRSLGSKVAGPENFAKLLSIIGAVDIILPIMYGPMYDKILSETMTSVPGAVYFVSALMTAPALVILIAMYKLLKKQEQDIVENRTEKEKYAHVNRETSVTTL